MCVRFNGALDISDGLPTRESKRMSKKKINMDSVYNPAMPWWKEEIYGTELMGMRLLRRKSLKEMAKVTGERVSDLRTIEKDNEMPVPPPLAGMYMMYLSCGMHHVYQFRQIVDGKSNTFNDSRSIGSRLKKQVYEKCKSKCVKCGSVENLHIHHIVEFSKGGRTELENLELLCASCHAEEHKDNQAYHMLKKVAERNE